MVWEISGCSGFFCYLVIRSCRRCARPFRNRRGIHSGGDRCASFQESCGGYPAFSSSCWRRKEVCDFRSSCSRANWLIAWVGFSQWYGCFEISIFSVLYLTDSTFIGVPVSDQLRAHPASIVSKPTGHQTQTLCKAVCGKKIICSRSPDEQLVSLFSCSASCYELDFRCNFCVHRTWRGIGQATARAFPTGAPLDQDYGH